MLKKKLLHFLLLCSLFLNITHDSVLAMEKDSYTESVQQYVAELIEPTECDETYNIHKIFHFVAILEYFPSAFESYDKEEKDLFYYILYTSPLHEKSNKPPIV